MPKAVSMITFVDRDDDKVYNVKVTIQNDFTIESTFVGDVLPEKPAEPSFGDKVESFIDKVTGGQLKKCGGCARRKALLNKLGGKDGQ